MDPSAAVDQDSTKPMNPGTLTGEFPSLNVNTLEDRRGKELRKLEKSSGEAAHHAS